MKLVHFTAPNGSQVGVNPEQVVDVRDAEPGMYGPRTQTVIVLGSGFQAVRESHEEVEKRLQA